MKSPIEPPENASDGKEEMTRFMKLYRRQEPGFFDKYDPMLLVAAGLSVTFVLFLFVSLLSNRDLFRTLL